MRNGHKWREFCKNGTFIRLADTAWKASMLLGTWCCLQQNLTQYRLFQFNLVILMTTLLWYNWNWVRRVCWVWNFRLPHETKWKYIGWNCGGKKPTGFLLTHSFFHPRAHHCSETRLWLLLLIWTLTKAIVILKFPFNSKDAIVHNVPNLLDT